MDGKVVIGTELQTKEFDAQIEYIINRMQEVENKLKQADMGFEVGDTLKLEQEYEKLGNQLIGLREKQDKYNQSIREAQMAGFKNIEQSIKNVGSGMENIIKKVAKWSLAVFGIRSIYLGIRQAVNQIMQEDENLKYQIEYIKYSIGQAIKPIVEFIVGLVYKIVAGVGALIKLIFGVNIFAKATAQNFKNAQGSAQKLRKTIAGFDELDIINENGTTGIGGAIDKALEGFGDINQEVDNIAHKIKLWFYGGDYDNIWEAVVENFKKMPETVKGILQPLWEKVVYPYLVKPIVDGWNNHVVPLFKEFKEITRPIWEPIKNAFIDMVDNYLIPTWDKFKDYVSRKVEELRPVWEPVKEGFIQTKDNLLKIFAPFLNKLIDGFNYVFGWLGWHLDYIETDAEETGENIVDEVGGSISEVNNMPFDDRNMTITINADTSQAERQTNSWLTNIWNSITSIGKAVKNTGLTDIANAIKGSASNLTESVRRKLGAKGMLYTPPKLAVGGIINQPGKGVPIGSAYGGERGMEGVIPLTDSQQMALLGEAIGKYINVNITNVTELDGRQIARKVDKIQQNNNFVLNR